MTIELPRLIEADTLIPLLNSPGLRIIDLGSTDTYAAYHLPGAQYLNYAQLVAATPEHSGPLAHDSALYQLLSGLGIDSHTHIVAYDDGDGVQACRFLWTLDLLGHTRYSLLNGGLRAWLDERHTTERTITPVAPRQPDYRVDLESHAVDLLHILQHLNDAQTQVVDCRTTAEYSGQDLRAQRGGHIPGAINLDHRRLIDPNHSLRLRPDAEIKHILTDAGLQTDRTQIVHCQSHRRSALVYFVLKQLGYEHVKAYVGSWAEWGNNLDTPIE